jgi:hypothetical protein
MTGFDLSAAVMAIGKISQSRGPKNKRDPEDAFWNAFKEIVANYRRPSGCALSAI